ncbi:MAG TPA: RNA polymerase sigma factor RpoD/SigA [Gemmatimonadaceae bacterium]|jgi:RNA polymerase primary sigma factor|nr:RNA polymerase sigma factor RpoD/SigA [Gemmatimonadaceae bacterium]
MSASTRRHRESAGDSLSAYLREIGSYPLLTPADEANLARRARSGDAPAADRLICSNLRFVVSVAKKYQHHGIPLADLIDEGNLGLIRAAHRFDETRGVRFISYAIWWVRQAIVQAIAESGHAVRVPLTRFTAMRRVSRHADVLRKELGREPTQLELIEEAGINAADAAVTLHIARAPVSLDAAVGDDARLLEFMPDDSSEPPDHEAVNADLAESIETALAALRDREATVVRLYFGFDGGDPMTLESIGQRLGVTRERVRQIKDRALCRLRKSDVAPALATLRGA